MSRRDGALRAHDWWHTGNVNFMRWWRGARDEAGPDPDTCEHAWRLRETTHSLSADMVWHVCDRCGALRPLPTGDTEPAPADPDSRAPYSDRA
jgi:hypothetical protein